MPHNHTSTLAHARALQVDAAISLASTTRAEAARLLFHSALMQDALGDLERLPQGSLEEVRGALSTISQELQAYDRMVLRLRVGTPDADDPDPWTPAERLYSNYCAEAIKTPGHIYSYEEFCLLNGLDAKSGDWLETLSVGA